MEGFLHYCDPVVIPIPVLCLPVDDDCWIKLALWALVAVVLFGFALQVDCLDSAIAFAFGGWVLSGLDLMCLCLWWAMYVCFFCVSSELS